MVYTGSINLVRSWTTTGRYGTFLFNTLFFFTHIVIPDRTKVGRCMDMDLPAISGPKYFCYSLSPPCSFLG